MPSYMLEASVPSDSPRWSSIEPQLVLASSFAFSLLHGTIWFQTDKAQFYPDTVIIEARSILANQL